MKTWVAIKAEAERRRHMRDVMNGAYANLLCTENHKPTREAFAKLARAAGWSEDEFNEWAGDRTWA